MTASLRRSTHCGDPCWWCGDRTGTAPARHPGGHRSCLSAGTEDRGPGGCEDAAVMRTVLIVDDHPGFRGRARAVLQAEGFGVVGDGAAAIQAVRALRPDVVLLDIQLPDMNGFQVAERLRGDGAGGVVVLISSRDAADYGTRVSSSPVAGFLAKADLSGAALAALLDGAGQRRGPGQSQEPRR